MDGGVLADAMIDGGAEGGVNWALVLVLVLVVVLLFVLWRALYRRVPNCAKYNAKTSAVCTMMQTACGGDPACLNAVAYCTPVVDAARAAGEAGTRDHAAVVNSIDPNQLMACGYAIRNIKPKQMAKMLNAGKACLPPQYANVSDAQYKAAVTLSTAAAPMLPYLLKVARDLPACAPRPPPIMGPAPVPSAPLVA